MRDGLDSQTAQRVAVRRAAHQVLDRPPIFDDPLAIRILPADVARAIVEEPESFDRSPLSPYLRAFFAVRSRFAEDELAAAVRRGITQYVVLGAGYDTFAYRNPFPSLRVFEVDHPSTQAAKRARLADAQIAIPENVTFVPVDFARVALLDALGAAGFDRTSSAFCSWLGVVMYLERPAIEDTCRALASCGPGTTLVFDYAVPAESLPPRARAVVAEMGRRVAAIGEPWKTYLSPADVRALLHRSGFGDVADFGAEELGERYLAGRTDGLRLGGAAHIAWGRV